MSVSEPFIRRPIATSLLGIALLIGGALGYWALPVSALPQVDFPTVQVTTQLPGASPDVIASLITAPLERQLGQIPVAVVDDLDQFVRRQPDFAAVRSQPRHRRRHAGRAGGDQRRRRHPAENPAVSADLRQGEPRGCAGHDAGADLGDDFAARHERYRRHHPRATPQPDFRRRPGRGARRAEAGGAGPGRSGAACRLWHRDGGSAQRHRGRQRLRTEGIARRRAAGLHHRRQRPDRGGRRLQAHHHRLPQRLAGHHRRRRHDRRRAGERPHRRLVPGHTGGHHRHPAPARRQRHRRGPPDPRGNSQTAARRFRPASI